MRVTGKSEFTSKQYDDIYKNSKGYGLSKDIQAQYRELCSKIIGQLQCDDKVIDAGCGTGQLAKMISDRGIDFVKGLDFSNTAIEISRKRSPGLKFDTADLREYDYGKDDFTVVIFCEVLEHIQDDIAVLKRVPADKRVILTVPSTTARSHVRIFDNIKSVTKRYSEALHILIQDEVQYGDTTFFIVQGYRK